MKYKLKCEETGKMIDLELTEEQKKLLGIKDKTGWEKVAKGSNYYSINKTSCVALNKDENYKFDELLFYNANYFSNKEKAEEINKVQILYRKMQRFADKYNDKIDWNDSCEKKYYIVYDSNFDGFNILETESINHTFQIYFSSKKLAKKAFNIFENELREIYCKSNL